MRTDRGIVLGMQVVLRIDIVDCSLGMKMVACLIHHQPQQPLLLGSEDVCRIIV